MCINRNWNYINSDKHGNAYAHRSDGLFVQFFPEEYDSIIDFIEKLEEFRNCQCSPNSPCSKHSEEKERLENARK